MDSPLATIQYENQVAANDFPFVRDHQVRGIPILPAAATLEMAMAVARLHLEGEERVGGSLQVRDLLLRQPLIFRDGEVRRIQTILTHSREGEGTFELLSKGEAEEEWTLHANAVVQGNLVPDPLAGDGPAEIRARSTSRVDRETHLAMLAAVGLSFGPSLHGVSELFRGEKEALARIEPPADAGEWSGGFHMDPAALDAALQAVAGALPGQGGSRGGEEGAVFLPLSVEKYRLFEGGGQGLWSHVVLRESGGGAGAPTADLRILDRAGSPVAELEGIVLRPVVRPGGGDGEPAAGWLHRMEWVPHREWWSGLQVAEGGAWDAPELARYRAMLPELEALCGDFVEDAAHRMGWVHPPASRVDAEGVGADWGVLPRHLRLVARLLEILAERGVLEELPGSPQDTFASRPWRVRRYPEGREVRSAIDDLVRRHPESEAQLHLTRECGRRLPELLRGEADPLAILFPGGSLETTQRLYQDSPKARAFNQLVQGLAGVLAPPAGAEEPFRVLEVGAGTGGTTASLLPELQGRISEYVFTDISPHFLSRAQETYGGYEFFRCRLLDLEEEPEEQGFGGESFHLIVAANVVHATGSLEGSLARLRRLLAPGGTLLLVEGTAPERWVDLTFGLTEGWWKFTDTDTRPTYPLIPVEGWKHLLEGVGFEGTVSLPGGGGVDSQAVILASVPREVSPRRGWILVGNHGDEGALLAEELGGRGEACVVVPSWEGSEESAEALGRRLDRAREALGGGGRGFVLLAGRGLGSSGAHGEGSEPPVEVSLDVVRVVQALGTGSGGPPPRLWLVTTGATAAGAAGPLSLEQAPVWGLAKVLRMEHPELRAVTVDLDPAATLESSVRDLADELFRDDDEDHVAWRRGVRLVGRLTTLALEDAPAGTHSAGAGPPSGGGTPSRGTTLPVPRSLQPPRNGVLEELSWIASERTPPAPGWVEIEVAATGLNFRDVMNVLGMRDDPEPLGAECCGRVVAVGKGVSGIRPGDEVVAVTAGGFATFAHAHAALTAPVPRDLLSTEAAGLPIAYLTAEYSLRVLAELEQGDRVLIHAAAGGVGLAAVHVARQAGAEILATAGSAEKRAYLRSLGIQHVMDSRSLGFRDEVLRITQGRGVEVVLNSLAGEFIGASVEVLASEGRFVELGKRDVWTPEQFSTKRPRARYHLVDLAVRMKEAPESLEELYRGIMTRIRDGDLLPLPVKAFPAEDVADAFRFMAQARHTGKVVVLASRRAGGDGVGDVLSGPGGPHGTYLVVGGLGGLGLLTAQWLADQGISTLALMGRTPASEAARSTLARLGERGVHVEVLQGDVSRREDVEAVLARIRSTMAPLHGVVHSAGVLEDSTLMRQEEAAFRRVLDPKVAGAWHLHDLTRGDPVRHFVLYSSTAALLGSPGQGAHAAANAYLDALAHYRRSLGLPALSINWGVWREVGSAAERGVASRVAALGVGSMGPREGLAALELALASGEPQVGVIPIDWDRYLGARGPVAPWLAGLRSGPAPEGSVRPHAPGRSSSFGVGLPVPSVSEEDFRRSLRGLAPARRREMLEEFIEDQVRRVIGGAPDSHIDPRQPLHDIGVDSLMAVELRNLLGRELGEDVSLPATLVFDFPTIESIAGFLDGTLEGADGGTASERGASSTTADVSSSGENGTHDLLAEIEDLSGEEVSRLLTPRKEE